MRTQGTPIYSLYQELKREITLTKLAPSTLNLPKRKNAGPLNFHIQTAYISNFKMILVPTVPDRVLSVTRALHYTGQTKGAKFNFFEVGGHEKCIDEAIRIYKSL